MNLQLVDSMYGPELSLIINLYFFSIFLLLLVSLVFTVSVFLSLLKLIFSIDKSAIVG